MCLFAGKRLVLSAKFIGKDVQATLKFVHGTLSGSMQKQIANQASFKFNRRGAQGACFLKEGLSAGKGRVNYGA
jgi:hypothetical protein